MVNVYKNVVHWGQRRQERAADAARALAEAEEQLAFQRQRFARALESNAEVGVASSGDDFKSYSEVLEV
jgi:hypothetical protein